MFNNLKYNFTEDDPRQMQRPAPPAGPNPIDSTINYIGNLFGTTPTPAPKFTEFRTPEIQSIPDNAVNLPRRSDPLDQLVVRNTPMRQQFMQQQNTPPTQIPPPTPRNFREAFAQALRNKQKIFEWNGKKYTTELAPSKTTTSATGNQDVNIKGMVQDQIQKALAKKEREELSRKLAKGVYGVGPDDPNYNDVVKKYETGNVGGMMALRKIDEDNKRKMEEAKRIAARNQMNKNLGNSDLIFR